MMGLFATKDRPWSTVDPADAQPCSHVCAQHPAAPYDGPKLSLAELDARALSLSYSPGAGAGYDRNAARGWVLGTAPEVADRISARIAALDGGVDNIVLNPLNWGLEQLELIAGEVLPRVKA